MVDRTHPWLDRRSLALSSAVADRLESQPELLEVARRNLSAWITKGPAAPLSAHLEWREILDDESIESIIELLRSDSERAARLRQSSPFAGLLSPKERWSILAKYDAQSA